MGRIKGFDIRHILIGKAVKRQHKTNRHLQRGDRPGIGSTPDPFAVNDLIFGGGVVCVYNMTVAAVYAYFVQRLCQMLPQHVISDTADKAGLRSLQLGVYGDVHRLPAGISDHIGNVFIHFGISNANHPNHFGSTLS